MQSGLQLFKLAPCAPEQVFFLVALYSAKPGRVEKLPARLFPEKNAFESRALNWLIGGLVPGTRLDALQLRNSNATSAGIF